MKRRILFVSVLALGIVFISFCFIVSTLVKGHSRAVYEARQAEKAHLTEAYGDELRAVIENYELIWHGVEAGKNLDVLSQVASGPFLERWQRLRDHHNSQDSLQAITETNVSRIVVLQYSTNRFKVIAYIDREFDDFTYQGIALNNPVNIPLCGEYVFEREDGNWKATAFFPLAQYYEANLRDWDFLSEWEKAELGEVPSVTDWHNICNSE